VWRQRTRVRTGRVHQREVEMDVSPSVRHESDQQRRTRCEAWCEERARAADGDRAARRARGASSSQQYTAKSKGESVSEAEWRGAKQAEVLRRRTVSTDLHGGKRILAICIVPSCSSPSSSHSSPGFNVIATTLRPAYLIPRYIHASTYFG